MATALEQLREMTVVVADTGDIDAIKKLKPIDCTTNPSILLKAIKSEAFTELFAKAIEAGRKNSSTPLEIADKLLVGVGSELASVIPGRVSAEVDANLSFNTTASVEKARAIIKGFAENGVEKDQVLIKLASTWEGIQAARQLEDEGINCNLTLLFCQAQAIASAAAGAFLISPFVGRITDWYGKAEGKTYQSHEDPGVLSVKGIYDYYKSNNINTIVMGASFRNAGQIKELAGCDRLTISPNLLEELASDTSELPRKLSADSVSGISPFEMDEVAFRWALNSDAMATEKLAEGIRNFDADHQKLLDLIGAEL